MTALFHALIVAAGQGARAGLDQPKQFAPLVGRPVLRWSVEAFHTHARCAGVTVVVASGTGPRAAADAALRGLPVQLIDGGAERQDSVRAGLDALDASVELVLVHDAARPGVDEITIDRLLDALDGGASAGAVPVLPAADTLARGGERLGETVDRAGLVRVQTPQAFQVEALRAAHAAWKGGAATDDAQMVRAAGGRVAMVSGSPLLDKITGPGDLAHMERVLADRALPAWRHAVGSGFDVHRLVPGDGVWLGGVLVPHDHRLDGHSDADVALHAITDALLGAIGAGDIGTHFPPSDPQWRGASSALFLTQARDLATTRGGFIDHVDCTIICEAPKVGPYRETIRINIARLLELDVDAVSVKATTTERLGFTGRGEGIAAQAVVSVALLRK